MITELDYAAATKFLKVNNPLLYVVEDQVSTSLRYVGFAVQQSPSDSDSVFSVMREYKAGTITKIEWASTKFNKAWADRSTLFTPAAGPFLNEKSIFFDGVNDYIELVADPSGWNFERNVARSISVWVKFNSLGAANRYIAGRYDPSRGWRLHYEGSTGRIRFHLQNAAANHCLVQMDTALAINTWYNIVVTYDGTSLAAGVNMYLNGALQPMSVISNNLTLTIINATAGLRTTFGVGESPLTGYLQGYIDEMSLYSAVLTGAQVTEIYNGGDPADLQSLTSNPSLISWFRMGDGDTFPIVLDTEAGYIGAMQNMIAGNISTDVP